MKIEEEIDDNKKELFYLTHKDCCKKLLNKDFFSTTGGGFSYIITPTGLGSIIEMRCNSCGEVSNVTPDYEW